MPSNQRSTGFHADPTQYAEYTDNGASAYCESLFPPGMTRVDQRSDEPAPAVQWPRVVLLAAIGLITAFLLAFLTLQVVRVTEPAEKAPIRVNPSPAATVITERQSAQATPTTVTVAPTATRLPVTTTAAPQPPVTTTAAPQPPATMTNPLEPPPATMTNPLEPPPATMTNPLEPPPATMTNPLEPPPGAFGSFD